MCQRLDRICRNLVIVLTFVVHFASMLRAQNSDQVKTAAIEGTVVYKADPKRPWRLGRNYIKDKKTGELAGAVVALSGSNLKKLPRPDEPTTAVIDQKEFRFIPQTVTIRAGDRVKFLNSDQQVHNVKSFDGAEPFNVNMPAGTEYIHSFVAAGGLRRPINLSCTFHSAMRGWVFVFHHPIFQTTTDNGKYRLSNIPPGAYRLEMVHPAGELKWSQEIEVKAGEKLELDIELSPDNKVDT